MEGKKLKPMFSARKAFKLQRLLAEKVSWEGRVSKLEFVVGLDLAYVGNKGVAVAALTRMPDLRLIRYSVVVGEVPIPYVPGLLAFREAPLMFKAYEKLGVQADLIVVDGHGVTHPRGLGIASHIGVVLDTPSIGAAKKVLTGEVREVNGKEYLFINGRPGAIVVRPRKNRAIYLSIGHKVGLEEIERLSKILFKGHSLPEPTYVADKVTKEVRRKLVKNR